MSAQQMQVYRNLQAAYAKLGRKPVTTASTLRLMQPVVANKTVYTFPVINGESGTTFAEQILLNRADAFTAMQIGVFIGGQTDAGAADTVNKYQLFGFQSEAMTAGGLTNVNSLFMHSRLDIAVNNVNYLNNWDLYRTYGAPIIQTGNIFSTGGDTTAPNSVDGSANGFADLTPTLQFSGTAKIDITISLPVALALTNAAQINLFFRGFLSLGASNLNK
tara:strand:+ start:3963 stop:4619 length:657 start_codon:yes stop_codon:yes gene_type:complete